MSTDLTALQSSDFDQIAALTGATVNTSSYLPVLKINRDSEDNAGNAIPTGTYCVSQDGKAVYSKTAIFRPFMNCFQYLEYDPKENTYPNKSVIIKSFNEEAFDELGGLRCGKVKKDFLEHCSPQEQLRQKNIKCYRHLYGLVTIDDIENLPVVWKMAASNFNAPKNALDVITKLKHHFFQHSLNLSLKREKNGATVYYLSLVEPNLSGVIDFTNEDMATFSMFQEIIDRENKAVLAKWKKAKKLAVDADDDLIDVSKELSLDDDLPFQLQ